MSALLHIVQVVLLLNLVIGLIRVIRGPSHVDRMLAAQLFGTTGAAILLVMAAAQQRAALRDVALVFALLAAVTMIAFVKRVWQAAGRQPEAGS